MLAKLLDGRKTKKGHRPTARLLPESAMLTIFPGSGFFSSFGRDVVIDSSLRGRSCYATALYAPVGVSSIRLFLINLCFSCTASRYSTRKVKIFRACAALLYPTRSAGFYVPRPHCGGIFLASAAHSARRGRAKIVHVERGSFALSTRAIDANASTR